MSHPDVMNELGIPEQLKYYAQGTFVGYYHQNTNAEFGLSVWASNAWTTLVGVATGITGVYPLEILWENATSIGISAAVVFSYDGVWHFFRFILLYGLLELATVFISIAAGLRIFWSLFAPGPMTRFQTVGQAARSTMTVVAGCAILLIGSSVLEGFVTPSGLPDAIKITLGTLMTATVWVCIFVLGRRAYQAGVSTDVDTDTGYYQLVSE